MEGNLSFRFNILVIEDELRWKRDLEGALQLIFEGQNGFFYRLVSSSGEAREQILKGRYHFVSIDQNLPDKDGEAVSPDHGLILCESLVQQHVVACRVIYTAYGRPDYGNRAGRLGDTRYLEKGGNSKKEDTYDSFQWAELIKFTLENEYIPFALDLTGKTLPLSLAERARRATEAAQKNLHEPYLRLWIELWESTLHLAFAQTLALCAKAGISLGRLPTGDSLVEQEQALSDVWPRLVRASANWLQPWIRYISTGYKEGGSVAAGMGFLQGASEPFRKLRNDIAHSFSRDVWKTMAQEAREAILFLIDALAFWTEHPFLTQVQFHPSNRHRIIGQAIMGDQLPFPTREIDVPTVENLPHQDHVCLPWQPQGQESCLLDLNPFVVFERDQQGRSHLLLLSHPARERGRWFYRSLTDGRIQFRTLSTEDQETVRKVFR